MKPLSEQILEAARAEMPLAKLLGTIENAMIVVRSAASRDDHAAFLKTLGQETDKIFGAYEDYRARRGF